MVGGQFFQMQHQMGIFLVARSDHLFFYLLNPYFKEKVKFHLENLRKEKSCEHVCCSALFSFVFHLKLFTPLDLCIYLYMYKYIWEQSEQFWQTLQCKNSKYMVLIDRKYFHMDLFNIYPSVNVIGIQTLKAREVNPQCVYIIRLISP